MLGPSLCMKKNREYPLGCLWGQIYTSTLALYGGLGIRMFQMTRLEAQFDTVNPEIFARTLFSRKALKDIFVTSKFVTSA